ncbi:MAG TPA: hypothetical protein VN048_18200 [Verrucomicrobiae bacterium]|jgi:hypothetical protein|nr:hypothetical protein [Verrucomicrobiae bacterium]
MSCSVMQKNLEPPTMEQLKQAFCKVPGLTAVDASIFSRDAFGILARSFELERAQALQSALAAQGVETEVVEDGALPVLPEARLVHRIDCTPDALVIYDPLGRSFPLKWENVMLIAAGRVNLVEFKDVRTETKVQGRSYGRFGGGDKTIVNHDLKEERHDRWLLEFVITGAGLRYNVNADVARPMLFQGLGERRTNDLAANFKLLVQDMVNGAPGAAVNRGAYYLRENSAEPFYYPTKKAFYDEMTWLLWKMK